jgi:hypothetical protein
VNTYTYSQARQNFAFILKKAKKEGSVLIKRKDGTIFELRPISENKSPLDVKGIKIEIDKEEMLDILKEVRNR